MTAASTLYERLGGETGVLELVTRFYNEMDSNSSAQLIRDKHPQNLDASRAKLFEYFSGWFGGPSLFVDKYGHPRLRARHKHIQIGIQDRDLWLFCLHTALNQMNLQRDLKADLLKKIEPMADHMRNIDEASEVEKANAERC